ncbi:MAG: sigma-70 family RNA polymerase sigma factor [Ruminococcus sp.]|nr:sigma-70 family RNA polymerase sigma factor [Ruminococcus sp.]
MILKLLNSLILFALHVDNMGVFPKPLSKKDEEKYFEMMYKGDKNAKDKLIEHNLRLVAHIVKKYNPSQQEQEELISIGTIGLIKAVTTFDYTKGAKFATYASRCIENSILIFWLLTMQNRNTFQDYGKYIIRLTKIFILCIVLKITN